MHENRPDCDNGAGADQAVSLVVDADRPGEDTAYVARGAGRYRLKIESANVEWYVQVEEP